MAAYAIRQMAYDECHGGGFTFDAEFLFFIFVNRMLHLSRHETHRGHS